MKKTKRIILTITEKCNLSCVYCYEKNKSLKSISFVKAKEIILQEFSSAIGIYDLVFLDLYGGEPFCEFELIKKIVEFIRENNFQIEWQILAMTNGTLITQEIKSWLLDNKDVFIVGLSMDGIKEIQDTNRCNSFDKIDLEFFKKNYAKQGVKMTVSPQTLPYLAESVIFFHTNGFYCSCSLAIGVDWGKDNNALILDKQLSILNDYYVKNPNISPCTMLGRSILLIFNDRFTNGGGWCDAGLCAFVYDVKGERYPCHMFTSLSAGVEIAKKIKKESFPPKVQKEPVGKCYACQIKSACPTCYAFNYISTGDFFKQDEEMCQLANVIIKKRADLVKRKLQDNLLKVSNDIEIKLKKAIDIIELL